MNLRQRAIAALVLVNVLWGLSFPITKGLSLEIRQYFQPDADEASTRLLVSGAAWIILIRFSMATGLLCLFSRPLLRSVRWPQFWAGSAIGTSFFIGLMLQVVGLATIPASRSGFLTSLVVVWTPVFATLLQRRRPRRQTIAGAAVSILGVSVLTGMVEIDSGGLRFAEDALSQWQLGDSLTSIAVLFFSLQVILVDTYGKRYESTALTPSMFASTVLLAASVFVVHEVWGGVIYAGHSGGGLNLWGESGWFALTVQPRFWVLLGVLSFFSTWIAFLWMNRFQPVLTAGQAAVIYTLEPLFASTWAMFLPGLITLLCFVDYENEALTWNLVVGGAFLIVANAVALWPSRKIVA